jgi:hypothetical protein
MRINHVGWLLLGAMLLGAACSEAPVVPPKATNRIVLAEAVSQAG